MVEIKAIVFDIGGVMASENNMKNHYIPLCNALKINKKDFFNVRNKYMPLASSGKITGKKLISLFAKELNQDYNKFYKNWIKYKIMSTKKNYKLEKLLNKIKNKYVLASLSGVIDLHQKIYAKKGIYNVFEFNIYSFKAGYHKPHIKLYQLALKRLKLTPQEVVVVDNAQDCLNVARKLGIHTILFKNNKQLVRDLRKLGVKI